MFTHTYVHLHIQHTTHKSYKPTLQGVSSHRKLEPLEVSVSRLCWLPANKEHRQGEKSSHSHVRTVTGMASENRFRGLSQDDCSRSGLTDELTSSAFLGGLPCWRVLQPLSRHFTECEEPRAGKGRLLSIKYKHLWLVVNHLTWSDPSRDTWSYPTASNNSSLNHLVIGEV